ncbi:hypothetical protein B0O80DRAFT_428435 [Mortierella sp. GBAus27b]|nr:hypothetical protein BGX31_008762 [Mortierella sp. GBA43]KAI8350465.1 hypothetical protein B0O80DRAFT_428435 [Mortierella sp. GBAus27b]
MKPTLKWKKSNRQLFSSSSKDKDAGRSSTSTDTPPASPRSSNGSKCQPPTASQQIKPMSDALTIPEIILSIALFLNRPSLVQCCLVCKDWYTIFQPLLFRFVQASDFDRPNFIRAFQDHTRFATSIEWIQESPVVTPPVKKHLWYRIFRRRTPATRPTAVATSARPHLLCFQRPFEQLQNSLLAGQTPTLKKLSVRVQNQDPNLILRLSAKSVANLQISTRGYPARKPRMYMEDILRAYPNLVNLTLEGLFTLTSYLHEIGSQNGDEPVAVSSSTTSPPTSLFEHAPSISNLTSEEATQSTSITSSNVDSQDLTTLDNTSTSRTNGSSTLIQSLNLRLVDISQEGLIALSRYMPNLKSLLIEEFLVPDMMIKIYRWTWSTEFIHSLRISFPHLRSLRFAIPFDNIKEDAIVEILKSFPLLTTVGFRNSHFGRRALETLQEHCKYVDCLDVSFACANREFKGALLRFLQSWSQLRELEADGQVFHLDSPMDDNVVRTPWACTKLEKLVCGFQGSESMIFQHLAQFPLLSSLTISYPAILISPVETTLAWMANSTKMEYFWFSQHRHVTLDKTAVRWMLQHWPSLKKIHVAGGGSFEHKENVQQWCRDAQRLSLVVECDPI